MKTLDTPKLVSVAANNRNAILAETLKKLEEALLKSKKICIADLDH